METLFFLSEHLFLQSVRLISQGQDQPGSGSQNRLYSPCTNTASQLRTLSSTSANSQLQLQHLLFCFPQSLYIKPLKGWGTSKSERREWMIFLQIRQWFWITLERKHLKILYDFPWVLIKMSFIIAKAVKRDMNSYLQATCILISGSLPPESALSVETSFGQ